MTLLIFRLRVCTFTMCGYHVAFMTPIHLISWEVNQPGLTLLFYGFSHNSMPSLSNQRVYFSVMIPPNRLVPQNYHVLYPVDMATLKIRNIQVGRKSDGEKADLSNIKILPQATFC